MPVNPQAKFEITAIDRTRNALQSADRRLSRLEGTAMKVSRAFGVFFGAGVMGAAVASISRAGLTMERFERTLNVAAGSAEAGARELAFVDETAKKLGLNLEATAGSYAKLLAAAKGTALQGQPTREAFLGISQASTVLGLSADQTEGALRALEQMISKGKVQAEELRGQLGERLPGAFFIAAKAMGVTTVELDEMLKRGEVLAEDLIPKLGKELQERFGDAAIEAANSAQASFARFENALLRIKSTLAEGVNPALAHMAELAADLIAPTLAADIQNVTSQIDALQRHISQVESGGGIAHSQRAQLEPLKAHLDELLEKYEQLNSPGARARLTPNLDAFFEANDELDKIFEKQDQNLHKMADGFAREFETAEEQVARRLAEFDLAAHLFTPEQQDRIRAGLRDPLVDGLEEIEVRVQRRTSEKMTSQFERVSAQLGSSLHRSFSDAFVGIETSFGDMLKRMAADFLASGLLQLIGSAIGGPFGAFLTKGLPGFATGGSFTVGGSGGTDSQLVAFRATPGERVDVRTPSQQGGGSPTVIRQEFNFPLAFPPQLEAFVRNVAGAAGRDAALQLMQASRGRF